MKQSKQFNNITELVIDDLRSNMSKGSRLSIAAASFSIYAYEALKKELEQVEDLRFIFTSPTFNSEKAKKTKKRILHSKIKQGTQFIWF